MGLETYKPQEAKPNSNENEINERFLKKLTPEAQEINLRINNPEKAELLERAQERKGETLLNNTLELLQTQLQLKAMNGNLTSEQADQLFESLKKDQAETARIKEQLIWNAENKEDDQREIIVEEAIGKLMEQIKKPDLN